MEHLSSSPSSAIIKCAFASAAVYAELRHHFLPHAAATLPAFNCLQLSRALTDLYSLEEASRPSGALAEFSSSQS